MGSTWSWNCCNRPSCKFLESPETTTQRRIVSTCQLAEDGFTSPGSFQEQITAGNIWQLWENKQLPQKVQETLSATTYPNDLVIDYESGTAEFNPDKKGINQSRYVPNKSYVNPSDGGVYLYEGDGQFKKIYP